MLKPETAVSEEQLPPRLEAFQPALPMSSTAEERNAQDSQEPTPMQLLAESNPKGIIDVIRLLPPNSQRLDSLMGATLHVPLYQIIKVLPAIVAELTADESTQLLGAMVPRARWKDDEIEKILDAITVDNDPGDDSEFLGPIDLSEVRVSVDSEHPPREHVSDIRTNPLCHVLLQIDPHCFIETISQLRSVPALMGCLTTRNLQHSVLITRFARQRITLFKSFFEGMDGELRRDLLLSQHEDILAGMNAALDKDPELISKFVRWSREDGKTLEDLKSFSDKRDFFRWLLEVAPALLLPVFRVHFTENEKTSLLNYSRLDGLPAIHKLSIHAPDALCDILYTLPKALRYPVFVHRAANGQYAWEKASAVSHEAEDGNTSSIDTGDIAALNAIANSLICLTMREVLRLLLLQGERGNTLLHYVARYAPDSLGNVTLLCYIDSPQVLTVCNTDGERPIDLLVQSGNVEAFRSVVSGIDERELIEVLTSPDNNGVTAFARLFECMPIALYVLFQKVTKREALYVHLSDEGWPKRFEALKSEGLSGTVLAYVIHCDIYRLHLQHELAQHNASETENASLIEDKIHLIREASSELLSPFGNHKDAIRSFTKILSEKDHAGRPVLLQNRDAKLLKFLEAVDMQMVSVSSQSVLKDPARDASNPRAASTPAQSPL